MEKIIFERHELISYIGIGEEFLLLDKSMLTEYEANTELFLPRDFPIENHFINQFVLPASVLIEACGQLCAVFIKYNRILKKQPVLGEVKFRSYSPLGRKTDVLLDVSLERCFDHQVALSARVIDSQNAHIVASGRFTYGGLDLR